MPPQAAFHESINWYRTALHELGHWTGHGTRLDRDQKGGFGSEAYTKEELVGEMATEFRPLLDREAQRRFLKTSHLDSVRKMRAARSPTGFSIRSRFG